MFIKPNEENGLESPSGVMTEKIYAFRPAQIRKRVGRLSEEDMSRVSEQLRRVFGL